VSPSQPQQAKQTISPPQDEGVQTDDDDFDPFGEGKPKSPVLPSQPLQPLQPPSIPKPLAAEPLNEEDEFAAFAEPEEFGAFEDAETFDADFEGNFFCRK
jgi:hypothetical protein